MYEFQSSQCQLQKQYRDVQTDSASTATATAPHGARKEMQTNLQIKSNKTVRRQEFFSALFCNLVASC